MASSHGQPEDYTSLAQEGQGTAIKMPRSRRVGLDLNPDSDLQLPFPNRASILFSSQQGSLQQIALPHPRPSPASASVPSQLTPPIPVRSPLRPPTRSISSTSSVTRITGINSMLLSPSSSSQRTSPQQDQPPATLSPILQHPIDTLQLPPPATLPGQAPDRTFLRPGTPPPLGLGDTATIADSTMPPSSYSHLTIRPQSLPPLGSLLDNVNTKLDDAILAPKTPPLLLPPDSPPSSPTMDDDTATTSSSSAPSVVQQQAMSKRQHALQELLSSEKAYATDLAIVTQLHIPMALGQHPTIPFLPATPPQSTSSASSSRTVSTFSDSSVASLGPSMTTEDIKTIFSNITEIALYSENFCKMIEATITSRSDTGDENDRVGELFLAVIPEFERLYKYYITRHSNALQHLSSLPFTPAFQAFLTETQRIATSLSHAWDLSSFLIKPVQRLLKYPLLLAAIIDETPNSHGDKELLKEARLKMEEVARNVNEGRRRAEVVKEVLSSAKKKIPSVNVSVAASVNLTKMKGLRKGSMSATVGVELENNEEAVKVDKLYEELKQIQVFVGQFSKNVVEWGKNMSKMLMELRSWSTSFGKVIGLSADSKSEAFDAFLNVVEKQLMPLGVILETTIQEKLVKDLAHLLATSVQPLKLLDSMEEHQPSHIHLLTMNMSPRNRPPPALLEASQKYLALRGQLATELPLYVECLHRGLAMCVIRLTHIQTEFWKNVRDRWGELWDMLRVEGERNAGSEETIEVWKMRWLDVYHLLESKAICQAKKLYQDPTRVRNAQTLALAQQYAAASAMSYGGIGSIGAMVAYERPPAYHRLSMSSQKKGTNVAGMLGSLDPLHAFQSHQTSPRTRARGTSDASLGTARRQLTRRSSIESLRNAQQIAHSHSHGQGNSFSSTSSAPALPPPIPIALPFPTKSNHNALQLPKTSPSAYMQHHQHGSPPSPHKRSATSPRPSTGSNLSSGRRRTLDEFGEYVNIPDNIPVSPMIPRTKSMPLPGDPLPSARNGAPAKVKERDRDKDKENGRDREREDERGRNSRSTSIRKKFTDVMRPGSSGGRRSPAKSGSSPTHVSFFVADHDAPPTPSAPARRHSSIFNGNGNGSAASNNVHATDSRPRTQMRERSRNRDNANHNNHVGSTNTIHYQGSQRDSWERKETKYVCQVVHPCRPPTAVSYYSFPFFTLVEGALYEILQEAGHPSVHPKLPLYVDDGEDCLLLCRDEHGRVGWALASFLRPLEMIPQSARR